MPFRVTMTSGEHFDVRSPLAAALLKNRLFITLPDNDHWVFCPFLHIASLRTIPRGRNGTSRRKRGQ
jgi:hypothetical protein